MMRSFRLTALFTGFGLIIVGGLVSSTTVSAQQSQVREDQCSAGYVVNSEGTGCVLGAEECGSGFLGLPTWYKYLELDAQCSVVGPTSEETGDIDWRAAAGRIGIAATEILLRVAAMVSVVFVMIGGFKYITSQGEPDSTVAARQTIQNALIGLVISLLATAIVSFIGNQFG